MPDYKNIKHFEGLNALRFFAAFLVVIHHAEAVRKKNGLFNLDWLSFFKNGGNAVTFFFVLSGFLITYLLLKEDNQTGETSIKTFYLKRTLRIWPLYFLMFFVVHLLVLPMHHLIAEQKNVVYNWLIEQIEKAIQHFAKANASY